MELAAIFLLILCYAAAGYLWWRQGTPIYLFGLLAGHLSALATPLWRLVYNISYNPSLGSATTLLDQPLPQIVLLAAGWYYPLPALVVLLLYKWHWWFPGYATGLLTYAVFLLFYLLIEALGLRNELWFYPTTALPFNIPSLFISAMMTALVTLALLYLLLAVHRFAWPSMLLALLPAALFLSLIVRGLLGAPLWMGLVLHAEPWMLTLGLLSTLTLLGWAIHIITSGISRVSQTVMY